MSPRFFRNFTAVIFLALAFALPAAAQVTSAKSAWSDLRNAARERGVVIVSQGATDYGTSIVAQNVRISLEDDPEEITIAIPELRLEPRGTALALIPSPAFTVTLHTTQSSERVFNVTHAGEVVAEWSEDRIAIDLLFDQLAATMVSAMDAGSALDEAFDVSFSGLTSHLDIERAGAGNFSLSSDRTQYSFRFPDMTGDSTSPQTASADINGLHIDMSGNELDMLSEEPDMRAAFDAGFHARVNISVDSSSGSSQQTVEGAPVSVSSTSGQAQISLEMANGAMTAETRAQSGHFNGGMGPMTGDISFDEISMALGFPMLTTSDDQQLYYRVNFENVLASPEMLQLVGAQDFAGDAVTLTVAVSAQGRLTQDMGAEFGEGDTPPIDLTSVSLDQLLTRVGDAELSGSGSFAFLGGMLASLGADVPNGTGDFVFDLLGGDALLTRLSGIGLIPPDQQFFARMMMNGLGRSVGEDHLRSEVAIRPGGVVTVNGAPLPF